MQIVILTGGRDFDDFRKMEQVLDAFCSIKNIQFFVGDCPTGLDHMARDFMCRFYPDIPVRVFKADWDTHGRAAGPIRNEKMVATAEGCFALIVAFPGGRGTNNTVSHGKKYGIPAVRVE